MTNYFSKRRSLLFGSISFGILALVLLVLLGVLPPTNKVGVLTSGTGNGALYHDYGIWSYNAKRDEGGLHITISYDKSSANALRAYAAANKELATTIAQTGGQAEALITFGTPLQPDEFRAWVRANALAVRFVTIRERNGNGDRLTATIQIQEQGGDPLPSTTLGALTRGIVQGVFSVHGTVPAAQLPKILADPRVFLLDITPTVVRRDLLAAGITDAADTPINPGSPFWQMEDFGLAVYTTPAPAPTSGLPTPVITGQPIPAPPPTVPATAPPVSTSTVQP